MAAPQPSQLTCRCWRLPEWLFVPWRRTPCRPRRCTACSRRGCRPPAAACACGRLIAPARPAACPAYPADTQYCETQGIASCPTPTAADANGVGRSCHTICSSRLLEQENDAITEMHGTGCSTHHQGSRVTAARTAGSLAAAAPTVAPPKEWPTIAKRCMSSLPAQHEHSISQLACDVMRRQLM